LKDFEITEVYRFEGDTNPSDEEVVYAVESTRVLHTAFGIYMDEVSPELLSKLKMNTH